MNGDHFLLLVFLGISKAITAESVHIFLHTETESGKADLCAEQIGVIYFF